MHVIHEGLLRFSILANCRRSFRCLFLPHCKTRLSACAIVVCFFGMHANQRSWRELVPARAQLRSNRDLRATKRRRTGRPPPPEKPPAGTVGIAANGALKARETRVKSLAIDLAPVRINAVSPGHHRHADSRRAAKQNTCSRFIGAT